MNWVNSIDIVSKSYICGYCCNDLASQKGYYAIDSARNNCGFIYICHKCGKPTFFDRYGKQFPGTPFGEEVLSITSKDITELYNEARNCMAVNAFTAAVMCCRKLLMNIAVSKGASEGQNFLTYVEYLSNSGYVPPNGKDWVDHIRNKGNEATHQIAIMNREDAEDLITFIEMLLKFIYEFPAKIKKKSS